MSSLPPVLPPNSPRTSPLKKLPRSSPPPTHTRRNSIEEIFLQSTAHATATSETNLDRRHLEEILLENDPKKLVMELKRQCRSRDLIINTLRESYLRDVILLKEQIIARDQRDDNHQEHRFEQERTVAASSISIVAQENADQLNKKKIVWRVQAQTKSGTAYFFFNNTKSFPPVIPHIFHP